MWIAKKKVFRPFTQDDLQKMPIDYLMNIRKMIAVFFTLLVGWRSVLAGDPGTTQGILDMGKPERPAEAITLVGSDGFNLVPEGAGLSKWVFAEGILTASPSWDSVITKESYGDFRMHVEFNVNEVKDAKDPESDGNSGVYIQQR